MIVALPLDPTVGPNQRFGTALSGTQYLFDVRWNGRDEAWYLDILAENGDPIRRGMRVVLGTLLGGRVVADAFPPGVLQAVDLTNSGTEAGLDDLGTRVQIYYYPFEDLKVRAP
jgi:hypothetical protein